MLDHVDISDCGFGIDYDAHHRDGRFSMRHTRVNATALGLAIWDVRAAFDLGTIASPGNNQIAVTSAEGFALQVQGTQRGNTVDAHGVTLNGATFEGSVQGPAELAGHYLVGESNVVRF